MINKARYYSLKHGMVNKGLKTKKWEQWNTKEKNEFDYYTSSFTERIGKIKTSGL